MSKQPVWKFIANIGDVNPLDYDGYLVYVDEMGVYPPEAEVICRMSDRDDSKYEVYRFSLDKCSYVNGVLSDNRFHPGHGAWFANSLADMASNSGATEEELIAFLCSDDPLELAEGYRAIGQYHGYDNLDNYPLLVETREDMESRLPEELV